ncbi:hypothetical protein FRC10_006311 [Ceratobasidium sp. 414]|nr:hypothetical protein FRC10_006311 [Ceratobasidium sp. 414]
MSNALQLNIEDPVSKLPSPNDTPMHDTDDPLPASFGASLVLSTPIQLGCPKMKQVLLLGTVPGGAEGGQKETYHLGSSTISQLVSAATQSATPLKALAVEVFRLDWLALAGKQVVAGQADSTQDSMISPASVILPRSLSMASVM